MVVQEVFQRKREPWRWGAQWLAVESWQWPIERTIEADPLTTIWEIAKELNVSHSTVIQHLKQIGKIKKLNKWVFHKLTENQKNRYEVSPSLIVLNNHEPFLDRIVMHKKWILYDNWQWPAQWLDQEEAPKHFPKSNLHHKKVMVTVWWPAATAFCILVKPLHLRSMLSKKTRCTKNFNTYSRHWSTERTQLFSTTMPDHISHNQHFKSWTKTLLSFASSSIFTWTLTNQPPLLQAS